MRVKQKVACSWGLGSGLKSFLNLRILIKKLFLT